MAITIQSYPVAYSSLQNDLIYTVQESAHTADPVTYPNYKFIGDVYIGATLVARIKKVPDPTTKIGIFNIGQIVRNYIALVFAPQAPDIFPQRIGLGEFFLNVTMKFGEEYAYTAYTNLTTDSERTFFNSYNGRQNTTTLSDMVGKPLSNRPYATPVRCDSTFNLIPFLAADTSDHVIHIKTYDYSNALAGTYSYGFFADVVNELEQFNFSKAAINHHSPGLINDSIKYYTVQIGVDIPEDVTYRFDINCECTYEIFTLHFLNKYGGFESKDFAKVSRKTISIEKKDFGKLPYTVDSSGTVSYKSITNVYKESRAVYSSLYKEKLTLNSDLLTDGEYTWLEELVISPMVYLEDNGSHYPVVISETNYEPKKVVNDQLTNLTISIEFGETLNAQFR